MSERVCRAFNLTVSVKEDISDECVKALKKWLTRATKYVYAVLEHETSKRHLHATMIFEDNQDKKKMRENLWARQVKVHHPTSIGRYAVHVQACPGRKWLDEYLQKEDSREIVLTDMPQDLSELDEYFPSQEVQKQLIAAKDKVVDVFYAQHEVEYKEWLVENGYESTTKVAHEYFNMRMFVRKDMRVNADSRRVHQMSVALHRYSTDYCGLTALEGQVHDKENGLFDFQPPL